MSGNIKFTKEIVNDLLRAKGICLSGDYINSSTKTEFTCRCGHKWITTSNNVIHKTGCPRCNGGVRYTIAKLQEIKCSLNLRGITFNEYKNSTTKVEFQCSKGHKWKTTLQSVLDGTSCPYCSKRPPLTKEDMNKRLSGRGVALIGEYKSCHARTLFECENGHSWLASCDNVIRNQQGCPYCAVDFTKPAYIYVLEIAGQDEVFTGFGISNSKNSRINRHNLILSKFNKKIIRQEIFNVSNKIIALFVENRLKTSLPIYNSGISGFITESTKLDFDSIINIVDTYILEKENNG